jgi:hypothetical protein
MSSAPAVPYFPSPPGEYSQTHMSQLTRAFETFVAQTRNSFLQESLAGTNWVPVPTSATAPGAAGALAYDANYIYVCTATDTWRRVAVASW